MVENNFKLPGFETSSSFTLKALVLYNQVLYNASLSRLIFALEVHMTILTKKK